MVSLQFFFFFQAEDGIRDLYVTGVQTCALPICRPPARVRVRMSKISDETNAPIGSGTSRGWKGWPSGPASSERFTRHGYPASRLLTASGGLRPAWGRWPPLHRDAQRR